MHDTVIVALVAMAGVLFTVWKDMRIRDDVRKSQESSDERARLLAATAEVQRQRELTQAEGDALRRDYLAEIVRLRAEKAALEGEVAGLKGKRNEVAEFE